MKSLAEIFRIFLRLGLTSFGGPVAHLGYFHKTFVQELRWLSEREFSSLVSICQFLPGPASSQVGMGIGLLRAGVAGAFLAWIGFILPSAALLVAFGYGLITWTNVIPVGLLAGLKLAAVAVVAQAVWTMANRFCPDRVRLSIAVGGAAGTLLIPTPLAPLLMLACGGVVGQWLKSDPGKESPSDKEIPISRGLSIICLILLALLLVLPLVLPQIAPALANRHLLELFHSFFSTGALVFGGGHVVLPLLQATVVSPGWLSVNEFLAGYGAAQAVPGPIFSLAAYLGTVLGPLPNGWQGALFCLSAIYLPSFLLLIGILPFWATLRSHPRMGKVQVGINAAVVGVLLAALYDPIWKSAVTDSRAFILGVAAFTCLKYWQVPSWLVVILCAGIGWVWLT